MATTKRQGTEIHKPYSAGYASGMIHKGFTALTANATATAVYEHALAEGKAIYIIADAVAIEDDASEATRCQTTHLMRRAASGDVTAVGTATSVTADDSSGTPTLTIVANTGAQTVDVKVTGEASKDLIWMVHVRYMEVSI